MERGVTNAEPHGSVLFDQNDEDDHVGITLSAKYMKEKIELTDLHPRTTILEVKEMLQELTNILVKRQKLVGLVARDGGAKGVVDTLTLDQLLVKNGKTSGTTTVISHQFILMGTPEAHIFVDPADRDDLPDVIDDFELDFTAHSEEWQNHVENGEKLTKFTERTIIHLMNQPRRGKPLLASEEFLVHEKCIRGVICQTLGLTGALSDLYFAGSMKRPFMDKFLTDCYRHYDLVVWSQTSWRWLETKLIELGMLTNQYKFLFVLDKTSMFTIKSTKRDGSSLVHHVKPLQLIWTKFPQWGTHNTVHIDDLSRNFALNLKSGLKCKAYFRKKSSARRDVELLGLGRYLEMLATSGLGFDQVDHGDWEDVVRGKAQLSKRKNI